MGTDGGKNDLLKGQTDKRLLEMIRSSKGGLKNQKETE